MKEDEKVKYVWKEWETQGMSMALVSCMSILSSPKLYSRTHKEYYGCSI